jgi:hypothetical protein
MISRCRGHKTEYDAAFAGHSKTGLPHLLTHLLTPWRRVLLENLPGSQLVKEFPTFYVTQRIISAFISARHLSLLGYHTCIEQYKDWCNQ